MILDIGIGISLILLHMIRNDAYEVIQIPFFRGRNEMTKLSLAVIVCSIPGIILSIKGESSQKLSYKKQIDSLLPKTHERPFFFFITSYYPKYVPCKR